MNSASAGPVVVCFGTRPQVIKASALLAALRTQAPTVAVDTGQHYDYELNALLYQQLDIREPDHCLEVGSGSHAMQTASILERIEPLLERLAPRTVVVIGDTNSTLGCALAAAKLRIPVVHVEAGLRSTDAMLAEEINRRMVDATSAILCAPSARIAERLRTERLPGRIEVTGDIARDVLIKNLSRAPGENAGVHAHRAGAFAFATLHRAELTSDEASLGRVIAALGRLDMPVLLPLHPRTRKVVEDSGLDRRVPATVQITAPLGYLESLACTRDAAAVITDSGGVQREAYWLGTPCVTVRSETEWAETVTAGANIVLAPAEVDRLPAVVRQQIAKGTPWDRDLLGDGTAADRIAHVTAALLVATQTQDRR